MTIQNQIVEAGGRQWKIREAVSMQEAEYAINMARCSGSVGSKHIKNETYVGGTETVLADVVQINSDGSERQAYQDSF